MRPFGNDITNIAQNTNSTGGGGGGGGGGDDENGNDRNNGSSGNGNGNSETMLESTQEDSVDPRIPPHIARIGGIVTFSPIAGRGVIRVVRRCEDAKENHMLDLSECQLIHIPDAVYHLMRNTELKTCDLSLNSLKKVSPKFAIKFNLITDLNLSANQLSKLPDEFASLLALSKLNISHNSFLVLPQVVYKLPHLSQLDAKHNAILEIDTEEAIASDCLTVVDLRRNPLSRICRRKLAEFQAGFRIEISPEIEDDW